MSVEDAIAEAERRLVGKRYLLCGDHPYAGRSGECIAIRKTLFGYHPVVRLDGDGHECFVMSPKNWKQISTF